MALELAEPEGFISIFIDEGTSLLETLTTFLEWDEIGKATSDYVERILVAFPVEQRADISAKPKATESGLIDPLSKRELEVLTLIEAGHSNQEIAEHLVITLHTVKKHSSNIYGKLGVNSRTQAVARARQLGLL